jgi:hypothetical protein
MEQFAKRDSRIGQSFGLALHDRNKKLEAKPHYLNLNLKLVGFECGGEGR